MINREKIMKQLNLSQNPLHPFKDEICFMTGICYVQLGNYQEAKGFFDKSIHAMFEQRALWKGSGQADWLVSVCILSGRVDLVADVKRELDGDGFPKKDNLYFYFADALMELLLPSGETIELQIQRLLAKPKLKDLYAIGLALQAILNHNQVDLDQSLEKLLQAHETKSNHGDLRETA